MEQIDTPALPAVGVVDWIGTVIFGFFFLAVLLTFELVERISRPLLGRVRFKRFITAALSWSLNQTLRLTGARLDLATVPDLPRDRPYIIVSNHQSMFDVPFIGWVFRRYIPQFISKIELARKIPAVSYSLRVSGDIMIDRGNSSQSLKEIIKFGRRIESENTSAVIFPEGTRARDGVLKFFKPSGLITLLKTAPRAAVIPVVIDGSWKFQCHRKGPVPFGNRVTLRIGEPLEPAQFESPELVVQRTREVISTMLGEIRRSSDEERS